MEISSPCAAQGWNPWTSSPSAPPVRTCLSRGSAKGSAAGVPACSLSRAHHTGNEGGDGWKIPKVGCLGKTCRARCPLTMGRISGKSSKALSASKTPGQMFLCLRQGAGCPPARSWRRSFSRLARPRRAAQGWGVAQRRKRVFAVLDLDGGRAGQVLFESEGVSGYTPPGCEARQGAAGVLKAALEQQASAMKTVPPAGG